MLTVVRRIRRGDYVQRLANFGTSIAPLYGKVIRGGKESYRVEWEDGTRSGVKRDDPRVWRVEVFIAAWAASRCGVAVAQVYARQANGRFV